MLFRDLAVMHKDKLYMYLLHSSKYELCQNEKKESTWDMVNMVVTQTLNSN
jgi:hypothetical protein